VGETVIDCGSATALGGRADNQDRCAISPRWVVLSDGAGGHAGGALAAELTVEAVVSSLKSGVSRLKSGEAFTPLLLQEAFSRANEAVRQGRRADPAVATMAATLTVVIAISIAPDESTWLVASIGDSPAWLVTATEASQVTEDDNVAAQLVREGSLTPEEALAHPGRHWITRAIGSKELVAAETTMLRLGPGDALLIASDGLDAVTAAEIHDTIVSAADSGGAARRLIDSALRDGGTDNVTAAVVRHMRSSRDAPRT
jgi:protein phosphatase